MRHLLPSLAWLSVALVWAGCPSTPSMDAGENGPADAGRDATSDGATDASAIDARDASDDALETPDAPRSSRIDAVVALLSAASTDGEAIDAILYDVAWNEGWPLQEGTRWLFVAALEGTSSVHFVSELNGWSTTAHPALRSATGRHHWVVLEDDAFVVAPEGAQYKWLVDGSAYVAPLEATSYGFDAFGRFGWVRPDPLLPHLEQYPDRSSTHLTLPRTLRAYLPAGFDALDASTLRTLLLHDGQNVFHPDAAFGGWRMDEALASPAFSDVVALAVDNAADRMDAYTHVTDDIGTGAIGGRADDYLAFLTEDVLPFFRARYGITARGDSLAMMGSSLGGLVTVYAALREPSLFGCGAALSPTLGWGSFAPGARDALVARWSSEVGHGPVALYLDTGGAVVGSCVDGDGDGVADDGDDADNFCVTGQFRDTLAGLGYAYGVDLTHWHQPGALHNEAAWAARADRALGACTSMGWSAP